MSPLPPKQMGLFKKVLKCYDYKQYKMGLKLVKQILSYPETAEHGETLAMKGLLLNCIGKKDEALDYVRRGLRNDILSHVCWHVYGLLQRSEHKYDEAIKCYRNALKQDKNNLTILRDLSLLQIQMRDLEGFLDTRYQLFQLRPSQRASWLGYAIAYHLLKDYDLAIKILESTNHHHKHQPIDYEHSELLLYQISIMLEGGKHKEALDYLNKYGTSQICDRLAVLEYRVQTYLALNRRKEAAAILREQLIPRNPERSNYYEQLEQALAVPAHDEKARYAFYRDMQACHPNTQVPFRLPLTFIQSPGEFGQLLETYVRRSLRKGLPALFRSLKCVYNGEHDRMIQTLNANLHNGTPMVSDPKRDRPLEFSHRPSLSSPSNATNQQQQASTKQSSSSQQQDPVRYERNQLITRHGVPAKLKIIEDLLLIYERNLDLFGSFDGDSSTRDSEGPACLLWVYYYLAQHYDYLGQYDRALAYVTKAIDHTPTLIELLVIKAKIHKHKGETEKAVEFMNEAQRLDTADRYLNSKSAKYMIRANKIHEAEELCSKFTRSGVSVTENLMEMQCMWFQIECAKSYYRQAKFGLALKKCYEIEAYFAEVNEDQFDFHTYCMRKMTLRAYISLLRLEDILKSHKFYFDAADIAIKIYLQLHDAPLGEQDKENDSTQADGGKANSQISNAELKKIKNKQRKAAAKAAAESNQRNRSHHANAQHGADDDKQHGSRKANEQHKSGNAANNNASNNNESATGDSGTKLDAKLDPNTLEHPSDPLSKALSFLRPLKALGGARIETHLLAFEIYRRQDKLMLMLQSIKRAIKVNWHHRTLQAQLADFLAICDQRLSPSSPESTPSDGQKPLEGPMRQVIELELPNLRSRIVKFAV